MLRLFNGGLLYSLTEKIDLLLASVEFDKTRPDCTITSWKDAETKGKASKGDYMDYKKLVLDKLCVKDVKAGGKRKERYYIQIPVYMSPTGKLITKYGNDKAKLEEFALDAIMAWYKKQQKVTTIGGLWEKALPNKYQNHHNSSKTRECDIDSYNRFIASQPIESMEVTAVNNHRFLKQWLIDTCERIRSNGYTITNSTIGQCKGVMNIILDYAEDQGLIESNLLRKSDFADLRYQIDRKPEKEVTWTLEEVEAIKEQLFIDNAKLFNSSNYAILTAIETGARVGEIVALKWSDLDFVNGWIHIQRMESRTKEGRIVVPWTKGNAHTNKGDRYVPFTAELQDKLLELKAYYESHGIICKDNFVFVDNYGDRKNTNEVDKRSRVAQKHLGIEQTKGMHSYRKTFATLYMKDSGNEVDLQMILGHSNFNTTSTYYIKAQKIDAERINKANFLLNTRNRSEINEIVLFKPA